MRKKIRSPQRDLVFCCQFCGVGIWATNELKCDRCGHDVVVRRRLVSASGKVKIAALKKGRDRE